MELRAVLEQVRSDLAGRRGIPQVVVVDLTRDAVTAEHLVRAEGLDVPLALVDGHVGILAALQFDHAPELLATVLDGGVQLVDRDGPGRGRGRGARGAGRCRRRLVDGARSRVRTGTGATAAAGRRRRLRVGNRVHTERELLLFTGDGAGGRVAQRSHVLLEVLGDVFSSACTQRTDECQNAAGRDHSMSHGHDVLLLTRGVVMYRLTIQQNK